MLSTNLPNIKHLEEIKAQLTATVSIVWRGLLLLKPVATWPINFRHVPEIDLQINDVELASIVDTDIGLGLGLGN